MKTIALLSALLISYFVYGFYLSQIDIKVVPSADLSSRQNTAFRYKGVLNVLSVRSQGTAKPENIVTFAKNADLDFVIFTDQAPEDSSQLLKGYFGTTVLMDALKFNYLDSKFFYLSANQSTNNQDTEFQTKITDYLTQIKPLPEQLLILSSPRQSNFNSDNFPSGIHGMEVINIKEISNKAWQDSKFNVLWSLLIYPFNSKLAFLRLFSELEENWGIFDRVAKNRPIVAFGGSEASAKAFPWSNFLLRFPSYQRIFEMMSQHVLLKSELTGIYSDDFNKIFEALHKGNFFICLDILGDPNGFSAIIKDEKAKFNMGDSLKFKKGLSLEIKIPQPKTFFEVVLLRNGELYKIFNTNEVNFPISEPGTYRIQVRVSPYLPLPDAKKWFSWIYTNPFYVE